MEGWLAEHPEWVSDWTKNSAIGSVQVAFNWAMKSHIIPENPLRGVTHRVGSPRRDMTFDEFRAILRATRDTYHKRRPTPGPRFREILIFLWYTGCRPSEATKLRWENVDLENEIIVLVEHKTTRTQQKPKPLGPGLKRAVISGGGMAGAAVAS
jgi:integrase